MVTMSEFCFEGYNQKHTVKRNPQKERKELHGDTISSTWRPKKTQDTAPRQHLLQKLWNKSWPGWNYMEPEVQSSSLAPSHAPHSSSQSRCEKYRHERQLVVREQVGRTPVEELEPVNRDTACAVRSQVTQYWKVMLTSCLHCIWISAPCIILGTDCHHKLPAWAVIPWLELSSIFLCHGKEAHVQNNRRLSFTLFLLFSFFCSFLLNISFILCSLFLFSFKSAWWVYYECFSSSCLFLPIQFVEGKGIFPCSLSFYFYSYLFN